MQELTPAAREAVQQQQDQLLLLIRVWPTIAAILILAGFIFLCCGGYQWRNRQKQIDNRERVEIGKAEAETRKAFEEAAHFARQNKEEKQEEVNELEEKIEEATSDVRSLIVEDVVAPESQGDIAPLRQAIQGSKAYAREKIVLAEKMAEELLARALKPGDLLETSVTVDGSAADFLLALRDSGVGYAVEVKALAWRSGFGANASRRIREVMWKADRVVEESEKRMEKGLRSICFYVIYPAYSGEIVEEEALQSLANLVSREVGRRNYPEGRSPISFITTMERLSSANLDFLHELEGRSGPQVFVF